MKAGKIVLSPGLYVRLFGALMGCVGFMLLAFRNNIWGTALIGIASLIIAFGDKLK